MKVFFCLCFDRLNLAEGCQPELVEGGFCSVSHNLITQWVYNKINSIIKMLSISELKSGNNGLKEQYYKYQSAAFVT